MSLPGGAAALAARGSLEMNPDRALEARELGALLAPGTRVYVTHLPRGALADALGALAALRAAGLEPVPHVAARRVASRAELEAFLGAAVRDAGVRRVLVIGGDAPAPAGPYADSVALVADRVLADCGVRELGIGAYPEGHPAIPAAALEAAIGAKLEAAAAQGLAPALVTQFCFEPRRIGDFCLAAARRWPGVPVHVGLAGPTDPVRLLAFARRCGVAASLRALRGRALGLARLAAHTDPGPLLGEIARAAASAGNVAGAHFFSFGGALPTAAWMRAAAPARAA